MEKVIRVVVIKEIKGSQYGVQLESSVRDRLAEEDKYEEEEEAELEKVVGFFQSKYFKANSIITYHFSAKGGVCEVYLQFIFVQKKIISFSYWLNYLSVNPSIKRTERLCLHLALTK